MSSLSVHGHMRRETTARRTDDTVCRVTCLNSHHTHTHTHTSHNPHNQIQQIVANVLDGVMTKPEAAAATLATLYGFPTPLQHPRLMTMMSRAMDGFPLPFVRGMEERQTRPNEDVTKPPGALYIFEPQGVADYGPCVLTKVLWL